MKLYSIASKWGAETLLTKAEALGVKASYTVIDEKPGTFPLCKVVFDGEEGAIREAAQGWALMDVDGVQS